MTQTCTFIHFRKRHSHGANPFFHVNNCIRNDVCHSLLLSIARVASHSTSVPCFVCCYVDYYFYLVTNNLTDQAGRGYFSGPELTENLDQNLASAILYLLSSIASRLSEIHVLLCVFKRPVESRVIFWIGLLLTLVHTVVWALFIYYTNSSNPGISFDSSIDDNSSFFGHCYDFGQLIV